MNNRINIRESNVEVFKDTENRCKTNEKLKEAIEKSSKGQYLVLENDKLEVDETPVNNEKAKIIVSTKRTLEAASNYKDKKVCIHNFASATNAGGGVEKGSSAQEEALCRCSTLYFNIHEKAIVEKFHVNHRSLIKKGKMDSSYNDDCIFTPNVVAFKTDVAIPEVMNENDWFNVDVITCAAPNLREKPSNAMNPNSGSTKLEITSVDLLNLHIKRMTRILNIAKKEKAVVVILGAFGCGAFSNPPEVVAEAMFRVVEKFRYDFEVIEFAVYCTPKDSKNFDVFKRRL